MGETQPLIVRWVARLQAFFEEDWRGIAGQRFRATLKSVSDLNQKHLHIEEKATEVPDLAWTAARGFASEKHAKSAADYAKAENERIDAALKLRVFEDKARQEKATAGRLESEASLARVQELSARIQLAQTLQQVGIAITVNPDGTVRAIKSAAEPFDIISALLNPEERLALSAALIDFVIPPMGDIAVGTLTKWMKQVGDSIEQDEPIVEISTDLIDSEIPCPVNGELSEILVLAGSEIHINQTIVARLLPKS